MVLSAQIAVGWFRDPVGAGQAADELRRLGLCKGRVVVLAARRKSSPTITAQVDLGIPEAEAALFHRELASGRTLVVIDADHQLPEVVDVLVRCGGYGLPAPLQPAGFFPTVGGISHDR